MTARTDWRVIVFTWLDSVGDAMEMALRLEGFEKVHRTCWPLDMLSLAQSMCGQESVAFVIDNGATDDMQRTTNHLAAVIFNSQPQRVILRMHGQDTNPDELIGSCWWCKYPRYDFSEAARILAQSCESESYACRL